MQGTLREGTKGLKELQPHSFLQKIAWEALGGFESCFYHHHPQQERNGQGWTYMWWSVHQPQWGSPELRHSPQVVYCSQDSTGTRDTCKGTKHTAQRSSVHSSKQNLSGSRPRFGGLSPITQQRFTKFVPTSVQKSRKNKKYWGPNH